MAFRGFAKESRPPEKKRKPAPLAANLVLAKERRVEHLTEMPEPTREVMTTFDLSCSNWACVSVLTHDDPSRGKDFVGYIGEFGHPCLPCGAKARTLTNDDLPAL